MKYKLRVPKVEEEVVEFDLVEDHDGGIDLIADYDGTEWDILNIRSDGVIVVYSGVPAELRLRTNIEGEIILVSERDVL